MSMENQHIIFKILFKIFPKPEILIGERLPFIGGLFFYI
jgi:hypothetical protein